MEACNQMIQVTYAGDANSEYENVRKCDVSNNWINKRKPMHVIQ